MYVNNAARPVPVADPTLSYNIRELDHDQLYDNSLLTTICTIAIAQSGGGRKLKFYPLPRSLL